MSRELIINSTIETIEHLLSNYTRQKQINEEYQKEIEHQKEKRENQKIELAILNNKQKEMNKLKNTVSSYCGMFRKQEREIRKLQKENEHWKNKFEEELEGNRKKTL